MREQINFKLQIPKMEEHDYTLEHGEKTRLKGDQWMNWTGKWKSSMGFPTTLFQGFNVDGHEFQ